MDSYYHRDEQLSTALITGGEGSVQNHYQYDAFGILLENGEKHRNRIRYTGQQYDTVTGQYYLRSRYYNSQLGRFLQAYSYLGDGLNLYAYCSNNPTMYYDTSGYAMTDEDYAKIKYDTDGSGYAYYQNNDYNNGLNQKGPSPFYEGVAGFQAPHMLQRKWAEANLSDYGYDMGKAPTISLGTGRTGIDSDYGFGKMAFCFKEAIDINGIVNIPFA